MMKFYDSDLASDNPIDIHSDHEPPKDKIKDKKLLKKTELRRFYKIIIRTGSSLPKPAKYDEISYKILEIPELSENETENLDFLKSSPLKSLNLGLNDQEEWFDLALESMKRDEIALIMIENLKYDENKFKVLDRIQYYYIQLLDWTTVIDLDANFNYMKKILVKGKGLDRCELCDEIAFNCRVFFNNETLFEKSCPQETRLEPLGLDPNIIKIIKTMKPGEKSITHAKLKAFEAISGEDGLMGLIGKRIGDLEKEGLFVDIELQILNIIKIDDLFQDHSALKRQLLKGRSTCKPDSNSQMYFDLQIRADDVLVFDSWASKPEKYKNQTFPLSLLEEEEDNLEFLAKDLQAMGVYLDEFRLSRVLKTGLRRMKKGEVAEILCHDLRLVNKGLDWEAIGGKQGVAVVRYLVKLYNFTEGKNTFTMTLEEKIENAKRKKPIGLELVKTGHFKRALKAFANINTYFELGTFNKDDNELISSWKLSSLLNTTLCQMKLGKWKELVLVADKILEFDNCNCKALYRKALALKELQDYEKALECINGFLKKNEGLEEENRKEIAALGVGIDKLLATYKNREKKMMTNMFKGLEN